MSNYRVILTSSDSVPVTADGFEIDSGSIVFYTKGIKTEEEKYPDSINVMAFAAGTWLLVTQEKTNES